jgi:D-hydroxyproline dehydrogenase subunit beta
VADVLVVGGGIIGAALAAQCARRGMQVTLCERERLAAGASGRNAGLVTGPHPPQLEAIARRSIKEYRDLHFATGEGFAFDRESIGSLIVADDAAHLGADDEPVLTAAELRAAEPLLGDGPVAGCIREARRIDAGAATVAWADEARSYGAEILVGCEARGLVRRAGSVVGVMSDRGQLLARTTIVAAGPWSWRVVRGAGFHVPVRGVEGTIAVTAPAAFRLRRIVEDAAWPALPGRVTVEGAATGAAEPAAVACGLIQDDDGRIVIGASLGVVGSGPAALAAVCRRAIELVPALAGLEIVETRTCERPMTDDGLPVHGPVPGAPGLVLCCGHNAQGVTWGPGAAAVVAESLISGDWDPAFLPERTV